MRIQLVSGSHLQDNLCKRDGVSIKFETFSPKIQAGLKALIDGCCENLFCEILEEDLIVFFCHLEELGKAGFLQYETPFLKAVPFSASFSLEQNQETLHHLSRFALCRQMQGKWVLETPLSSTRMFLTEEGSHLVQMLCEPISFEKIAQTFPQISEGDIRDTLSLLFSAKMVGNKETEAMAHWEFHDLVFHSRSRRGRFDAPLGGTFRFRGVFPSQPATKKCLHPHRLFLPRPEKELPMRLEEAIERRSSIREHGEKPITLQQLGEFLWRSSRIKSTFRVNEEDFVSRPYPGGGARYELEIYPIVDRCDGLEPGVYHYHPEDHSLCSISPLTERAEALLKSASLASKMQGNPQVLLQISARFQRVSWKYQSIAYAVILKNVGVLLQTMYLLGTASDLAVCAIGAGDSDLFCEITQTDYLEETAVGELMLGSLP